MAVTCGLCMCTTASSSSKRASYPPFSELVGTREFALPTGNGRASTWRLLATRDAALVQRVERGPTLTRRGPSLTHAHVGVGRTARRSGRVTDSWPSCARARLAFHGARSALGRDVRRMRWSWRRGYGEPVDPTLRWESGGSAVSWRWRPDRVAVPGALVGGRLPVPIREGARRLAERIRFEVVLVSAAEFEGDRPGGWPDQPLSASLYRRPNSGYDFGTWSATLAALPQLCRAREVIPNDSMVGPFSSPESGPERMLRTPRTSGR